MREDVIAVLVGEWFHDRQLDMADEDGVLDGSGVSVSTQIGSHAPFPPEGGLQYSRAARRLPPSAGPAA